MSMQAWKDSVFTDLDLDQEGAADKAATRKDTLEKCPQKRP